MKFTSYLSAAFSDMKAGKKKFIVIGFIMSIGLLMLILTNSIEKSINNYLNLGVLDTLAMRTVFIKNEETYEVLKTDDRVESTYQFVESLNATFVNAEELIGLPSDIIGVYSYCDSYERYMVAGRGIENENEIVVPKYLFEYGNISANEYVDIENILGKTITLRWEEENVYTLEVVEEITEEFVVVGIIDNIASVAAGPMIDDEYLYQINCEKKVLDKSNEEKIIENLYMFGYDETYLDEIDEIFNITVNRKNAVVCKTADDVVSLEREFGREIERIAEIDPALRSEVKFIAMCFRFFAIIILVIVFINMILMVIHNISGREWDFALRVAFGYERETLSMTIAIEYVIITLMAFVMSLIISAGLMGGMKHIITRVFLGFMSVKMTVSLDVIFTGFIVCVLSVIVSFVTSSVRMKNIDVAKALKMENE